MSWQRCPVCDGFRSVPDGPQNKTCTVCRGKKIISVVSGRPPEDPEPKSIPSKQDLLLGMGHTITFQNSDGGKITVPYPVRPSDSTGMTSSRTYDARGILTHVDGKPVPYGPCRCANPEDISTHNGHCIRCGGLS